MSFSRPRVSALAAAGLAGVLVLALSACTPEPEPKPTPTATASAAPIFASDEEALAAAVEAYEAYERVSYEIAADGGNDAARIATVTTSRYAAELEDEFAQYTDAGIRAQGDVDLDSFELVKHRETADGVEISIYVCRDVSGVRVLDANGKDVTPADRPDVTPLQAFLVSEERQSELLVDRVDLWSGADFC
ncbi:hypothetical protein MUN74_12395 [Agromyces endophyticus]|uniref:hypothetical protein n=1 Tax=Agromyces sp. H17E-10 TaxID=2932244 RepID=UPI001FD11C3C|nr:hypothetical protein [Agromyces sp. H17E-10]UOQ88089.1 hypothetical protein MUN74_12395 [Agromyces sp. H17E-10]